MLEEIGDKKKIPEFIKRAQDPDDSYRLMGFGHRVYKNYDPRAKVMRETCHEVLKELNIDDPLAGNCNGIGKDRHRGRLFC